MLTISNFTASLQLISANNPWSTEWVREQTGPSALFGLQDAYALADRSRQNHHYELFDDGCHNGYNGTGPTDCTYACSVPRQIWADKFGMHTLSNCLMYPMIAQAMTYGRLDAASLDLARQFNIQPASRGIYNATSAVSSINACIFEYCSENNPCDFYTSNVTDSWDTIAHFVGQGCDRIDNSPNAAPLHPLCTVDMDDLCATAPDVGAVNNDLGGPGVFVSYVLQYTVCVLSWVVLNIMDLWVQIFIFFIFPGPFYWHYRHPRGLAGGWKVATRIQKSFRQKLGRQHDACLAALVEFQKTQSFFCIAIAVAVYVQITGNLNTVDAKTLQQLQNNTQLSNAILYGGLYPLSFVLMLLRRHGLSTPFFVVLAVITMVASAVALRLTATTDLNKIPVQYPAPNLSSCFEINPIQYCHSFRPGADMSEATTYNGYWWNTSLDPNAAYILLVLQVLDTLKIFPNRKDDSQDAEESRRGRLSVYSLSQFYIERLGCWTKLEGYITRNSRFLRRVGLSTRSKLIDFSMWVVRHAVELLALYFIILSLLVLLALEGPDENNDELEITQFNLSNWTFGQITALLFWAPPVVEYLRIALSGIVTSLNARIPQQYTVVKKEEPEEPEMDPPTRAATERTLVEDKNPPTAHEKADVESPPAALALPTHETQRARFVS